MAVYSIKDLENFTGIKAHTLRMWEKRYNLVEPKRTLSNIRYYDDDDLKKLLNVSILNKNGYKISNIVNLSDEKIGEQILNLAQTSFDIENQIESLVIAMIDLDENKFEKVFHTAILKYGFEEAVLNLIYPFFEKVGLLWQIGTINPAQEHFISNLIRQKMIVAIDGLITSFNNHSKNFLLFLPEGEYHELGLIFYHYLIKKRNHHVIYLGESVPMDALDVVSKSIQPDYLLTSVVTSVSADQLENMVISFSEHFNNSRIFLSGMQGKQVNFNIPKNITLINSASEFKQFLDNLD